MQQNLLTTGEFAKLACTTKRTIQYYDKLGILEPFKINTKGYRYYRQEQILDFQVILLLRTLGLPLRDVKEHLSKDKSLKDLFKQKKYKVRDEIRYLKYTLRSLDKFFTNLDRSGTMVKPKVKQVKPFRICYIEKIGSYSHIASYCDELLRMFKNRPRKPITLAIFEEKGYRPKRSKMKIGVIWRKGMIIKDEFKDIVKKGKVPKFKALTYMHNGSGNLLSLFWKELEKYAQINGYKQNFNVPRLIDLEIYWKVSGKEYKQFFEIYMPIL